MRRTAGSALIASVLFTACATPTIVTIRNDTAEHVVLVRPHPRSSWVIDLPAPREHLVSLAEHETPVTFQVQHGESPSGCLTVQAPAPRRWRLRATPPVILVSSAGSCMAAGG